MSYSIPFSSIKFGVRERTKYDGIEDLAESISDVGLQCPIILSPLPDGCFRLEDGGRRFKALESLGVKELFHGATSDPLRPGFVVKSEVSSDESAWLTELIANLHRDGFHWQDELRLIVKAFREEQKKAHLAGKKLYYRTFGKMLGGYGHGDINAAVHVHDAVMADPERFKDCQSITHAYQKLLDESKKLLEAELAKRRQVAATIPTATIVSPSCELYPSPVQKPSFDLGKLLLGDSISYLEGLPPNSFDHIICDPDFAVSVEDLSSNSNSASEGVAQSSVEDSLSELHRFIRAAYHCTTDSAFLIFFYDLNHHEKLLRWTMAAGWRTQRWPIIWHKTDFRSNGAPSHNACKNIEYAMICRKPGATLTSAVMSSVISLPVGSVSKDLGHPFSKPFALWTSLFKMVATPGQRVFDPFMGAGSSIIAGIKFGLDSSGMELNPAHHSKAIINVSNSLT